MIFVTADLHISDNPRDSYRLDNLGRLARLIKKSKPEAVVIIGDLTEEKDRHRALLVNQICAALASIADVAPLYISCGNHDYSHAAWPFFNFLNRFERIKFITRPAQYRIGGHDYLFLPHTHNPEDDWTSVQALHRHSKPRPLVFAHQTFEGANVGPRTLSGVPLKLLKGFKVISGDVHVPHETGNVTYVGSPWTVDFGDNFRPRALAVEQGGRDIRSITLGEMQNKALVNASVGTWQGEAVLNIDKESMTAHMGDIVKLRVSGSTVRWDDVLKLAAAWATARKVQLWAVEPEREPGEFDPRVGQKEDRPRSDDDLVDAYGVARGLSPSRIAQGKKLLKKL